MGKETSSIRIENKLDAIADNFDRKISNLHEKVNNIAIKTGKIETHLSDINGSMKGQKEKMFNLEKRVRWTENKVHIAIGGVGVVAAIMCILCRVLGII